MRVLHVLHTTTPDTSGYSIRSKYIVDLQRELGIEPMVVSSCRHPNGASIEEVIDGTHYHRTSPPSSGSALKLPGMRECLLMRRLYEHTLEVAQEFKPDLIHAHSPVLCGIPAEAVARRLKIPFVYEIRDLWENASVDKGKFQHNSLRYRLVRRMETRLVRRADAVVTICQGLAREIRARGVPDQRIWLAPNGVDLERFVPRMPNPALIDRYGLSGARIIGYVGSFFRYEGLDTLVGAMPAILKGCPEAKLVLVGSGDEETRLRKMAQELGVADQVVFTGRVPHQEVPDFYAVSDVLVYPRIETPTTRLTTPLKPLEAMAMRRAVVASDVTAMKELISDGRDGLLFRSGHVDSLSARCLQLLQKDSLREALGKQAYGSVREKRDWRRIIQVYPAAYQQVTK